MTPKESIRDIVDAILRDCRVPEERRREYHEQMTRAVWRDRAELMDLMESQRIPGGVDLRVARFVQSQASGRGIRPL